MNTTPPKKHNEQLDKIPLKLLIMSGKGGVGKTTVAVELALRLRGANYTVGLLDTDLHGPNVTCQLALSGQLTQGPDGIEPVLGPHDIKIASLALAGYEADAPIIWRGPLKIKAIEQFLHDVNWGELDCLIIDSPPGTGDEPLTVAQSLPDLTGAIIVTTPQSLSLADCRRSINFAKSLKLPIIGIVENMSEFICPHCGTPSSVFGQAAAEKLAAETEVPYLGHLALQTESDITPLHHDRNTPFFNALIGRLKEKPNGRPKSG